MLQKRSLDLEMPEDQEFTSEELASVDTIIEQHKSRPG